MLGGPRVPVKMLSNIRANDPHGFPQSSTSTIGCARIRLKARREWQKLLREYKQVLRQVAANFTMTMAVECDATKIRHRCCRNLAELPIGRADAGRQCCTTVTSPLFWPLAPSAGVGVAKADRHTALRCRYFS